MAGGHRWERLALEQFFASVRGVVVFSVGPLLSLIRVWMLQRPPHKTSTQRVKKVSEDGMPHQCLSDLALTHVWFARAGGLELGHAWISPHFSLGILSGLCGVRSTGFWIEGYNQPTE